jgi:hypothetical protein
MTTIRTTQGRAVTHCHVPHSPCTRELNADEVEFCRRKARQHNPDAVEISQPTSIYNCHGFAYAESHGWFSHPERFFEDDFDELPLESAREDDFVIYMDDETLMHSAKIIQVTDDGEILELHSKWGHLALLSHTLHGVPRIYGRPTHLVRRRE